MEIDLRPAPDVPVDDAEMLGHDMVVSGLRSFLEDGATAGPMCVALDGEWGSGKTSILRTLERRADPSKLDVVMFNAWKYEYSGPAVGLVSELAHRYRGGRLRRRALRGAVRAAARVASNNLLGTSLDELVRDVTGGPAAAALSDSLRGIVEGRAGGRRLVVMIDDLDRCDPGNALQVLSVVKLFLDLEGCVCVAAVDYERMVRACKARYGALQGGDVDASRYMEKMFQVRVAVPEPGRDHVAEYACRATGIRDKAAGRLVASLAGSNPRSIKLAHNLACHRAHALRRHGAAAGLPALLWTLLDGVPPSGLAGRAHSRLRDGGSSLGGLLSDAGREGYDLDAARGAVSGLFGDEMHDADRNRLALLASMAGPVVAGHPAAREALDRGFDDLRELTRPARRPPWP